MVYFNFTYKLGNIMQISKPVIWCIGGIDPICASGLAADLKAADFFNIQANIIVSANTVQNNTDFISLNAVDDVVFLQQFQIMTLTSTPKVIKTGLITTLKQVDILHDYLKENPEIIYICD